MDEDADLDPIRDDPAFAEIMKAGHPDRRYAAVWSSDASFEASPDLRSRSRRPPAAVPGTDRPGLSPRVALSVARTTPEGPLVTASVWHRPVITEEIKDRLAERQARAAVALVRMGKAEEVWPLLRHSADPRLRSFIVNWLNPLGADPKLIAAELDRIDPNAKPTPAQGQQKMDAILFHPETSQRRALILALGTYGTEGLSPGEREPLIGKLLDLYRNDPDAGIHGAAEWTLRQWEQQEKLKELDAQLMKLKDRGDRRWFVNGQGQTFAVIEGPVEFRMGSPPTEPDRDSERDPASPDHPPPVRHRRQGGDGRAVSEVRERRTPRIDHAQQLNRYSPDPEGPMIGSTWYHAAAYCNWLSEQEGLPKDQWCYVPNEQGQYAEGMTIPADVLRADRLSAAHRGGMGIRLPGGYGDQPLLRSSRSTCWGGMPGIKPTARSMPGRAAACCRTTWGCSTCWGTCMNGARTGTCRTGRSGTVIINDNINISEYINEKIPRLLRGGSFNNHPAVVRSACRGWIRPGDP